MWVPPQPSLAVLLAPQSCAPAHAVEKGMGVQMQVPVLRSQVLAAPMQVPLLGPHGTWLPQPSGAVPHCLLPHWETGLQTH